MQGALWKNELNTKGAKVTKKNKSNQKENEM
jgi:hypothetical protein